MNEQHRSTIRVAAIATLLLTSCILRAAEPPMERISIDDFGATSSPASPLLSTDGTALLYTYAGRIYATTADGSDETPVTAEKQKVTAVTLSADDSAVFFLMEREGSTQLYRKPIDASAEAIQVSQFEQGMSSANLSPQQTHVVISVSDNELKSTQGDAAPQPIVVTRRHFKKDSGNGYIVDGDQKHLHVHSLESGKTRQLTFGRYDESSSVWSPNGKSVLFVSNREQEPDIGNRTDLWIVDVDSASAPEIRRLTDSTHSKWSPSYSPDGSRIAYAQAKDGPYGQSNIAVIPAEGGEPVIITRALDRWVQSFQWSDDGKWIYLSYQNGGAVDLARVRVSDLHIDSLIVGDQVVQEFDVARDGTIAAIINGKNDASELYVQRNKKQTPITSANAEFIGSRKLGEKTKVRIESVEDVTIDVFITTPPDYEPGRAYPAVLNLHGGPQSQFSWGYGFSTQYFASQGYVVIEPNPRGSTGRGQTFIEANYRRWGVDDFDDVMAAVDYAVDKGIADPDKLVVTGYSYGGCLTNSVITRTNRFKAAASGAGESHAEAGFGHNLYTSWYVWELGLPWENRDAYDVHAPFLRAGHVETPTMFLGGAIDWNQPIQSSELFYQALQVRGVDTQLIVYPGVHHGGWGRDFEMDYLRRITAWFERYVNAEGKT